MVVHTFTRFAITFWECSLTSTDIERWQLAQVCVFRCFERALSSSPKLDFQHWKIHLVSIPFHTRLSCQIEHESPMKWSRQWLGWTIWGRAFELIDHCRKVLQAPWIQTVFWCHCLFVIFWKACLLNRNWQGLLCTIGRFRQSTIDSTFPEIFAILKQCGWGEVWTLKPESTIQLIIQKHKK